MREPKFDPRKMYLFDEDTDTFNIDIDLDFYRVVIAINLPATVFDATTEEQATQGFHNCFTSRIRR